MAHYNASKGKGFYKGVQEVEQDLEGHLTQIQNMLIWKTYKTSPYEIFTKICGKKEREIYKLPYFPDRIVHWAIIQVVEPIFLKRLNGCTHSAIPGRGIHSALKQVDKYITSDKEGTKYCLKIDIEKFYPNLDHVILKQMYRRMFKDEDLLWLLDEIIESTNGDKGVPIGNYLSQYSGNLYLAKFDRHLKEDLSVKYYTRYMDDIVILHSEKKELHKLNEYIKCYLQRNLSLNVKPNDQVFPTRVRGVDFVGYRHFGDYILLRKSIAQKLKKTMRKINKKLAKGGVFDFTDYCSINSYKGWLKWCNGYNLHKKWIEPLESECDKYYKEVIKNGGV